MVSACTHRPIRRTHLDSPFIWRSVFLIVDDFSTGWSRRELLTNVSLSSRSFMQYGSVFIESVSIQWYLSFQVASVQLHVFVWWRIHRCAVWIGARRWFLHRSGHVLDAAREQVSQQHRPLAISHRLWLHLFPDVGLHHHLVSLVKRWSTVRLCITVFIF